jgi:hypothetical protein
MRGPLRKIDEKLLTDLIRCTDKVEAACAVRVGKIARELGAYRSSSQAILPTLQMLGMRARERGGRNPVAGSEHRERARAIRPVP